MSPIEFTFFFCKKCVIKYDSQYLKYGVRITQRIMKETYVLDCERKLNKKKRKKTLLHMESFQYDGYSDNCLYTICIFLDFRMFHYYNFL